MVLKAALHAPQAEKLAVVRERADPIAWLEKALRVDFQLGPSIMRVGLDGNHPEELAAVVNAVANAYLAKVVEPEKVGRLERIQQLEKLLSTCENQERMQRETQRKLGDILGERPLSSFERDLLFQDLLDCKRELRRVRLARVAAEARAGKDPASTRAETAVLEARQKFLAEDEKLLLEKAASAGSSDIDLQMSRDKISQLAELNRRLRAELATLKLELEAPPRVTWLLEAAPSQDKQAPASKVWPSRFLRCRGSEAAGSRLAKACQPRRNLGIVKA
jgi:hypothetical protein